MRGSIKIFVWMMFVLTFVAVTAGKSEAAGDASAASFASEGSLERSLFSVEHSIGFAGTIADNNP